MLSERMQMAIEYKRIMLEIRNLEDQIFGKITETPVEETEPAKEEEPAEEPKKRAPKQNAKNAVDKGKILALAKAGWKRKDIAEDVKCSEATVYAVLKEAKNDQV